MFESEKNNPRCKNVSIIKLELVDANVKQRMEAAIKVVNEERERRSPSSQSSFHATTVTKKLEQD